MATADVLIIEIAGALTLGHAPALVARYAIKRGPLSLAVAVLVGTVSCILLALLATATHETLGVPQLRVSASLVGVSALLSIVTMVRGKRERLILRLQAMIADPVTTADRRQQALDRLEKLSSTTRRGPDNRGNDAKANSGQTPAG